MKIIDLEKSKYDEVLNIVFNTLKKSGVIVTPTDTIYGLSALSSSKKAIEKIYNIKKRSQDKKFIFLVSDLEMTKMYAKMNNKQEIYLKSIWPGPVTVILEAKPIAKHLSSKEGTIAIRNPGSNFLIDIIKKVNKPIVSTSVNTSGYNNLNNSLEINEYFQEKENKPDLIIKSDSGAHKSSRIVNIIDINNPIILRK